jgi:hypothetical protein
VHVLACIFSVEQADFYKILYEFVIGGYSILALFDFLMKSNIIPGVTLIRSGGNTI